VPSVPSVRSVFAFDKPMEHRPYSIGMPNKEPSKADVLQGTLDLMVLQTVATLGPLHGYAIAARLEQVSRGALQLNMGTLYPGLMRLEQRGLVRAEWGVTDNNRKARFYAITSAGRRRLAAEKAEWDRMSSIITDVLADQK
jgi:PadR family transcriptional regulator PadR